MVIPNVTHIYYALTEEEAKRGIIYYRGDDRFDGKYVHTTLSDLRKFLVSRGLIYHCPYYTVVPIHKFDVIEGSYGTDGLVVRIPFRFTFTKYDTID